MYIITLQCEYGKRQYLMNGKEEINSNGINVEFQKDRRNVELCIASI